MTSNVRRSDDGGESSYDRDSSSHQYHQHQRRRQQQPQQYHSQPHLYNQPFPPNNSYPREKLQHGQMPNQYPPGNSINANGNYNSSNTVPVPPRMRLRKWSDMTRTIWHYERIEQIGEGTYGQVYRARCKDTNEIVAMKKIRVHHGAHWGMPPTVIREIKILKRLVHPNLVRMVEVVSSKGVEHLDADDYHKGSDRSRKKNKHKTGGGQGDAENNSKDNKNSTKNDTSNNSNSKQIDISDAREGFKGNLFLVLEYVPHDLTGLLDVAYKFSEVEIKCVFRQLLEALRYMHNQKYVHRDIKSSNILIDRHFRLKLADFGLARSIEPPLLDNLHDRGSSQEFTNKVITLWYRPPELLLGATRYGFAVDIWSAGCILAELVLGRPLFTGKTEMDQLQLIFDMVGTPTSKTWPGVRDLKLLRTGDVSIDGDSNRKRPKLRERYQAKMNSNAPGAINLVEKLLELDPSKRLTASAALNNRYFLQKPQAPDQPEELGEMKLAEGGSFHEFQTKKKRKEAKAQAEKIKQAALDGGQTTKQAQEEFDACYRGIMEKVAQEGLASSDVANSANDADLAEDRRQRAVEGDSREFQDEKILGAKERDNDGSEERHRGKHRSSRSDRSPDHRTGSSRSTREKDSRDSSSRGRERRPRDRSVAGNSTSRHDNSRERREKNRDGPSTFAGTSKEVDSSHHRNRDHGKERSRSSRRASESEDRRKRRRREEEMERSTHIKRDREKDRQREHRKAPKVKSDRNANKIVRKGENQSKEIASTVIQNKEGKVSRGGVEIDESFHKLSSQKGNSTKPKDSDDIESNRKMEKAIVEKQQPLQGEDKNEISRDFPSVLNKSDEQKESKPDKEKKSGNENHSRSTSSRGDKKRSDRSRDKSRDDNTRKDRRDRDHDRDHNHRRRSSKDKDGRSRDGDRDRASSGRSNSSKKRKIRTRSPEGDGSPGNSRDDRHHRHRRDRDHLLHERDRERRRHHSDLRDSERRPQNVRPHHHDDWGPRGHPPAMQRRGGDFGGNAEFGGPQHPRHNQYLRGGDPGPYGGGDWGPRGDGPRGGPGDFRGPPGRHLGPPHGGRPMDYYPPGDDHPPPGYRDRDRGPRRDQDRR